MTPTVAVTMLLAVALASSPTLAGPKDADPGASDGQSDPEFCEDSWGVCLYEHPNYTGPTVIYGIAPGMRQKSVASLPAAFEDKVSSIKVGANVAVAIFIHRDWGNDTHSCGWPDLLLDHSVPQLGEFDLNDKLSSLVVVPKGRKRPLGAWACDLRWSTIPDVVGHTHLFPVPDVADQRERAFRELGACCDLDKNINRVWSDDEDVSVVLFEDRDNQGASLALPGENGWQSMGPQPNLGAHGWSDRAASLVVRWNGKSPGPMPSPRFRTLVDTDMPGADYGHFGAPAGPSECERACESDPRCKGYTWTPGLVKGHDVGETIYAELPACWLKTDLPPRVDAPGLISGMRAGATPAQPQPPPQPGTAMVMEYGVNRPGADFRSFPLQGGPEECQRACATDANCRSFTWVKPGVMGASAACWLKSSIPAGIPDVATVSGYVQGGTPEPPPPPPGSRRIPTRPGQILTRPAEPSAERTIVLEPGFDRPGSDYRHFTLPGDHTACQAACANEAQCKSFTWVKAGVQGPEATCWLKTDVPKALPNANTVSGVVK